MIGITSVLLVIEGLHLSKVLNSIISVGSQNAEELRGFSVQHDQKALALVLSNGYSTFRNMI